MLVARKISFFLFVLTFNFLLSQEKWSDSILISKTGSNRATHYLESNKIIENDKFIFTTILEFENDKFYNTIYRLDKKTKSLSSFRFDDVVKDNHCGASIAVDKFGYIYTVIGGHNSTIKTYISKNPWSIKGFRFLTKLDGSYTYPNLVINPHNNIPFLILRNAKYDSSWTIRVFRLNNEKWEYISDPIVGNYKTWLQNDEKNTLKHTRGYQNFSATFRFDADNRMHILYRIYEHIPNNFKVKKHALSAFQKYGMSYMIGYSFSDDFGKTWVSNDINMKQISPEEAIVIKGNADPRNADAYYEVSNLMINEKGCPIFLFIEKKDEDNRKVYFCEINELDNILIKEIEVPLEYEPFGKPRISSHQGKMHFVVSVMEKKIII